MSASDGLDGRNDDRRQHSRMTVYWQGNLSGSDLAEDCYILDISPGGARVQCANPLLGSDRLTLSLAQGEQHDAIVVWRQGSFMGLHFAAGTEPKLAA